MDSENLCRAAYKANQIGKSVVVVAFGTHPVAGYEVRFQDLPDAVFPPPFELRHRPPDGPTSQVETPFVVWTSFPSEKPIKTVSVRDADGEHEIEVEQTPDRAVCK